MKPLYVLACRCFRILTEVISRLRQPSHQLHIIGDDDDIIDREKQLQLPLHKRLELVAGFNIHQLIKDARQQRHTLHTREGFYLSTPPREMAALFERSPTRWGGATSKSTKRLAMSAKSKQSTTSTSNRSSTTATSSKTSSIQSDISVTESGDLIHFAGVHGCNVSLSQDRLTATRRNNSFCDGIVLGHRPINVGERINIKLNKVRRDWRGGFRLGFTHNDPSRLIQKALPSYAVPDLSRKSRFWAVPVPEKYVSKNNVFSFLFQKDGRVLYSINNESKGTFLKGLSSRKIWFPVMDLYGRVIEVSIIDDRTADLGSNFAADDSEGEEVSRQAFSEDYDIQKCSFHQTCGRNVRMDARRCIAKRVDSFWNSLTFLAEPLRPHDVIYIEIARANTNYAGALGVGVTDVNPSTINIADLPDNADLLTKNTSQYWLISRDIETSQGDQLGFEMNDSGQIMCSKNGETATLHMSTDVSKKPLWFVLDVYGSTTTIRLMGIIRAFDPSAPVGDAGYSLVIDDVIDSEEDTECLMCFKADRQRNCAIQPCGHVTLCCWCAITCMVKQTLRFIVCPTCGGPVCNVVKIMSRSERRSSVILFDNETD